MQLIKKKVLIPQASFRRILVKKPALLPQPFFLPRWLLNLEMVYCVFFSHTLERMTKLHVTLGKLLLENERIHYDGNVHPNNELNR
jgi:hypothetical protein